MNKKALLGIKQSVENINISELLKIRQRLAEEVTIIRKNLKSFERHTIKLERGEFPDGLWELHECLSDDIEDIGEMTQELASYIVSLQQAINDTCSQVKKELK